MKIRKRRTINIYTKALPIAILLCVACFVAIKTQPLFSLNINGIIEKAALASAVTALPEKGTQAIKERFADEFQQEEGKEIVVPQTQKPIVKKEPEEPQKKQEKPKDESKNKQIPIIPKQYRGEIKEQFFGVADNASYIKHKNGYIRNSTNVINSDIEEILKTPWKKPSYKAGDEEKPLVFIYHTHATESFEKFDADCYDKRNTWRSTDNNDNITLVGEKIADILKDNGIPVVQDKTQHDYPSYNGSYERSAETLEKYLKKYPSIEVALDIHRDAIQHDDVLIKPIYNVGDEKAAQIMIIAGCDDGTMNMPNWKQNLRFGAELQNMLTSKYEGIARPLFFAYRKYNQDMCTGGLLLEIGSHGNTLEEALKSGEMVGEALAELLKN